MNPLTNMKNVTKLSERELQNNSKSSWHDQYRDSAWIFIGGLPYDLTEGDIICIFSQYGEIANINLIRDKDNGKSKGFCFLCYEDQRSTILAVDNFNGIKVLNRILRVDHVSDYKIPKEGKQTSEESKKLYNEGCAPRAVVPVIKNPLTENPAYRRETLADQIQSEIKLPARLPIRTEIKREVGTEIPIGAKIEEDENKKKKSKNNSDSENEDVGRKKKKKKKKNHKRHSSSESESEEKEQHRKEKTSSQHSDRNLKHRNRSRSRETQISRQKQSRNSRTNSEERSRSSERQYRRSHSRDTGKKRYTEKSSESDWNKREKRRRSRS